MALRTALCLLLHFMFFFLSHHLITSVDVIVAVQTHTCRMPL